METENKKIEEIGYIERLPIGQENIAHLHSQPISNLELSSDEEISILAKYSKTMSGQVVL